MNRRDVLKSSLLGAGAFALPSAASAAPAPGELPHIWPQNEAQWNGGRKPNILWICTDMQRFDTIEGLNNDSIHTPNLRKLMAESVTLTHTYVQSPVCSPSRASMLTGRYPHTTGLRALGQRIRPSERLVTQDPCRRRLRLRPLRQAPSVSLRRRPRRRAHRRRLFRLRLVPRPERLLAGAQHVARMAQV